MDYVAFLRFRASVPAAERDGALMRRAAWKYPDDVRVIAETGPRRGGDGGHHFSADSFDSLLELELEWGDVLDIDIHPAVRPTRACGSGRGLRPAGADAAAFGGGGPAVCYRVTRQNG